MTNENLTQIKSIWTMEGLDPEEVIADIEEIQNNFRRQALEWLEREDSKMSDAMAYTARDGEVLAHPHTEIFRTIRTALTSQDALEDKVKELRRERNLMRNNFEWYFTRFLAVTGKSIDEAEAEWEKRDQPAFDKLRDGIKRLRNFVIKSGGGFCSSCAAPYPRLGNCPTCGEGSPHIQKGGA
ncbi:MAG: hypothetical protein JKY93_00950 [Gammaproteobacteria bacterium]|nr:hypothetical protein [Gammaproteobacteria bacterium]